MSFGSGRLGRRGMDAWRAWRRDGVSCWVLRGFFGLLFRSRVWRFGRGGMRGQRRLWFEIFNILSCSACYIRVKEKGGVDTGSRTREADI